MGHLLQYIEINRLSYIEGKEQKLRKYAGLTLNQPTTQYLNRYFDLSHNVHGSDVTTHHY